MKINYISEAVKILIIAATIIVVCVLCALGFKIANDGKAAVNTSSAKLNNMAADYNDIDKMVYNGSTVLGSEIINIIKSTVSQKEYLSVWVKTNANKTTGVYYNYVYSSSNSSITNTAGTFKTSVPSDITDVDFINSGAQFDCTVYKDDNNNVICMEFVQQKK